MNNSKLKLDNETREILNDKKLMTRIKKALEKIRIGKIHSHEEVKKKLKLK